MTGATLEKTRRRPRIVAAGVIALAGLAGLAALSMANRQPPPPALPDPNGYDLLLRAAKGISGPVPDLDKADAAALRAFLDANREPLALAQRALTVKPRVPLGYSKDLFEASLANLGPIRQLGRLLVANGLLAEKEGHPAAALPAYVDAARLGPHSAHGGFLMHELTGFAIQAPALKGLERIHDKLDPYRTRWLATNLQGLDESMDSPASVIARERAWFRATADLKMRIGIVLNPGIGPALDALTKPAYRQYEAAHRRAVLQIRRTLALTAVRAYRLDVGADPPGLKALVPKYLVAVPLDPSDGRPLVYRDEPGEGVRVDDAPADPADEVKK